jgi:hypothetical protein
VQGSSEGTFVNEQPASTKVFPATFVRIEPAGRAGSAWTSILPVWQGRDAARLGNLVC